ncbi:hypothetical protein F4677DRAFT_338216 [Hypoxylon crocopeplum]|nr:hypothetical protein F4677DRAFT_338216 [Hypoxylon crocopeplum]
MADNNTNGIEKGATGEATVPESQPSPLPVAKGPMNAGEESMEPSIATDTAGTGAATAPSSDDAAQNDTTTTTSKGELTEKLDAADKLAAQPEKPADPAPAQSASTETDSTDAPSLPNGDTKAPPKPVTVEEVRDQDMPAVAPSQPVEMTGALPVKEADDAPKADPAQATAEPEKAEPNTGDKRKPSDAEASNGDAADKESLQDAPADKKQKTNGAITNGVPRKVGRPKKDKKAAPTAGRTARKTRSQGAAD